MVYCPCVLPTNWPLFQFACLTCFFPEACWEARVCHIVYYIKTLRRNWGTLDRIIVHIYWHTLHGAFPVRNWGTLAIGNQHSCTTLALYFFPSSIYCRAKERPALFMDVVSNHLKNQWPALQWLISAFSWASCVVNPTQKKYTMLTTPDRPVYRALWSISGGFGVSPRLWYRQISAAYITTHYYNLYSPRISKVAHESWVDNG